MRYTNISCVSVAACLSWPASIRRAPPLFSSHVRRAGRRRKERLEMKRHLLKGFTIVELLVVVSIIALLIGILLPAIGKARDKARTTTSVSNLRQLAIAHNAYAGDWEDSQMSLARYNISAYGSMAAYNDAIGWEQNQGSSTGHPPHEM